MRDEISLFILSADMRLIFKSDDLLPGADLELDLYQISTDPRSDPGADS